MAISTYLANKLLNHVYNEVSYTPPTDVYIALYTDAGGTTEVTGGSYARKLAVFSTSTTSQLSTTAVIDFANMPACTVRAVWSVDQSGNQLQGGTLGTPITVTAGNTLSIPIGNVTHRLV